MMKYNSTYEHVRAILNARDIIRASRQTGKTSQTTRDIIELALNIQDNK